MSIMAFQPVNSIIVSDRPPDMQEEIKTPTTPRANALPPPLNPPNSTQAIVAGTRDISLAEQKPLPSAFVFPAPDPSKPAPSPSGHRHHDDMEVDGSDDDQEGSDNETENGEPGRSSKGKRGQRFFCTDYPPCSLSFTRSEHLARHIRKHTGERPFQCYCNRRFSRLDNLRQHAQTVHINEEIPADSLAATGTRYQRTIRTEKLRPATGRARSGTFGSQGGHSRGHSRNLSTSSIGSTASSYSAADSRRRPPPLLMAGDTGRPSNSERPSTPTHHRTYSTNSASGMTTPTSATYSTNPGSPAGYGSFVDSPVGGNSRPNSFYAARTPARRLSVPASGNPFQPSSQSQAQLYMSPPLPSSGTGFSNQSSTFASPTASQFRFEGGISSSEAEWRRRTWHPPSHPPTYAGPGYNFSRPGTSALSISQTPDTVQAPLAPHAPSTHPAPRLPGIESFDHVRERPSTPPRRQPSPMQVDTPPRNLFPGPANFSRPIPQPMPQAEQRKGHMSWDGSSQSRFGGPILPSNVPREVPREMSSWNQPQGDHRLSNPPIIHQAPTSHPPLAALQNPAPQTHSQTTLLTPSKKKRQGWFNGPLANQTRRSPEDSSSSEGVPTPGTSAAELHPAIVHSNGFIEPHHPGLPVESHAVSELPNPIPNLYQPTDHACLQVQHPRPGYFPGQAESHDMGRLEALVAVATSEDKATAIAR